MATKVQWHKYENLVLLVEAQPCLWDMRARQYRDWDYRLVKWEKLAEDLQALEPNEKKIS